MEKKEGAGSPGRGEGSGVGNPTQIEVKVGDETKVLSADEVTIALSKAKDLDAMKEDYAPFSKVLTQYGINLDEYLRNSEASFALMNQLIEQGVIDEQGNVIEKKAGEPKPTPPLVIPAKGAEGDPTRASQVVLDALTKIGDRMTALEEGQSNIYRRNIARDVKALHPNLDDGDISKLLAKAQSDRSKSFWDHVEVAAGEKTVREGQVALTHAKSTIELLVKAGVIPEGKVDLEKLDLAALEKQDKAKLPPVHEGKKFMFGSRQRKLGKTGDDEYTLPGDAMKEMLDKQRGG